MWHKIYWVGKHATLPINSPLGKVHREGLELLHRHGWAKVGTDTDQVPVFAFTTRKGDGGS